MTGLVFDMEEFAVYDGPGIRSVVFLKGCPLRCRWCHNPEGLSFSPQRARTVSLCKNCGLCEAVCTHPDGCIACGACVNTCPAGCLRIAGTRMTVDEVAARILPNRELLAMNGGGVTFSGGEALSQADFVLAVCERLPGVHKCIETSGFAPAQTYRQVVHAMDLVIQDIKIMNSDAHKRWTGVDNVPILENVRYLMQSGIPFRVRVPLIPTVNDTLENMRATADFLRGAKNLEKVELLPYHRAAGAKYAGLDMRYDPGFPTDEPVQIHIEPFKEAMIPCGIL